MTVFAKKSLNVNDWAKIQNQIGELQMALGGPHDLMMFSTDDDSNRMHQNIYIGVPDDRILAAFPGFERIEQASLPDYLCTLVVREDGFEKRFPDIAKKRRTKYG